MKIQMTLGELIKALQRREPDQEVHFAFVHFHATNHVASYRGYYEQLAIGYAKEGEAVKVGELLKILQDALGKTFTGWKGGEYDMHDGTPMWVANSGETGSTVIVDVVDLGWRVILETAYQE